MIKKIQVYNNTNTDPTPYLTAMFQYYQKHGVTFNYDIMQVNVPVPQSTLAYNPLVGSVYVVQGVENLVPQTDHDIVLFFYDYSNWKAPWYWPWPLWGNVPRDCTYMANGKPFITIGYWPTDNTVQQRFLHEPMHALARIFGCQDVMDTYLLDSTPDAPGGNFAQQWAILQPYMNPTTPPQSPTSPNAGTLLQKTMDWLTQEGIEGFRAKPYLDSTGRPTIGVGFIQLNGVPVTMSTPPITLEQAQAILAEQLKPYMQAIDTHVTYQCTDNQKVALYSICYNEGVNAIINSTLVRDLNAGLVQAAADQFLRWVYAGGKAVQGLINRRTRERTLFLTA